MIFQTFEKFYLEFSVVTKCLSLKSSRPFYFVSELLRLNYDKIKVDIIFIEDLETRHTQVLHTSRFLAKYKFGK
jgi:hypothetical protein